jgi:hypothetical protein
VVNAPSPLVAHEIAPLADEYPAGMAKESRLEQTVAELVPPAEATGTGIIVRVKVVRAGGHEPPLLTVIVSVMGMPAVISFGPKVYVGVAVVALMKVPSPLELHNFVPLADEYPGGTV